MRLPHFDTTQRILGFLKDTPCLISTAADVVDSTTKSSEVQLLHQSTLQRGRQALHTGHESAASAAAS